MSRPLTQRQAQIIRSIVNDYCDTGIPVGSAVLVDKFGLDISSATVRKEMSVLEQMGFLSSPHTSSGRIPTDSAFEIYVSDLIDHYNSAFTESDEISDFYRTARLQIDQLMKEIASMLAMKSRQLGIVLSPSSLGSLIRRAELVSVLENVVLLLLVTEGGNIYQKRISLERPITQEDLYKVSRFLTRALEGYELEEIQSKGLEELSEKTGELGSLSDIAIHLMQEIVYHPPDQKAFSEGMGEFYLKLSEDKGQEAANKMFKWLKNERNLRSALAGSEDSDNISVKIGLSIDHEYLSGISIVSKGYSVGGKFLGKVGIMGLSRMPYDTVIPAIDNGARILSNIFSDRNSIEDYAVDIHLPEKK